jgi:hypothetical protein
LTPIVKAYCAQRGFDVCIQAIQVYGGYGYIKEYPVEQLARDCKIASIYEGTDGIQAMDLLARKLGLQQGRIFKSLMEKIHQAAGRAKTFENLASMATAVEKGAHRLAETAAAVGQRSLSPEFKTAFAHAFPFLEVMGDVIVAWMLLWRASIAQEKLNNGAGKKDRPFYEGQIKTAEFFIRTLLPVALGKMDAILDGSASALEISESGFGGL